LAKLGNFGGGGKIDQPNNPSLCYATEVGKGKILLKKAELGKYRIAYWIWLKEGNV
jgi:hypothetical protein